MNRRLVFGVGPVRELISSSPKKIECLLVAEHRQDKAPVSEILAEAKGRGLRAVATSGQELNALVPQGKHQGLVAVVGEFVYADLHDVITNAGDPGLIVALDGVSDPHNLGAIVRSALLLGADAVLIPKDRAARVTSTVTKSSAGATEHLPIAQVTNLVRALEDLREAGYWRAAVASSEDALPPHELDASLPLVLVLGSEGSGIRQRVAKHCDFRVEIPMHHGRVGSFNVSVAAAIVLYEIAKQRQS